MMPIPGPIMTAELDYHRERIAVDFAAANMRRRYRSTRRAARRRHGDQRSHRPTAARVADAR